MTIRPLTPADAAVYQALRLEGLLESPAAFGSSHRAEVGRTLAEVEARLQSGPDAMVTVLGAFCEGKLVGMVALIRTATEKLAHNAMVGGMYVTPAHRRRGIGEALLDGVIAQARTFPQLRNLKLSVNATNCAAIALYRSRGFVPFGLEREALCVNGVYYDEEHYALPMERDVAMR